MDIHDNCVLINDPVIVSSIKESIQDTEYIGRLIGAFRDIVSLRRQSVNVNDMFENHFDEICDRIKNGLRDESIIGDIQSKLSDLKYKLDGFTRDDGVYLQLSEIQRTLGTLTTKSSSTRGKEAENSVIDLLSDELLTRDGYIIENVSGVAHNCDICVKRTGYNDVRIDVKNYTEKVPQREIDKFRSDLNTLQCSGIMLCTKNGIVGKKNLEFEQLPCGKFAIFLTNNNYDMSIVCEAIRLIYFLENATEPEDAGVIQLNSDKLSIINASIGDWKKRLSNFKTVMKTAMNTLEGIDFTSLENIMRASPTDVVFVIPELPKQPHDIFECSKCHRSIRSKAALVQHEKSCKYKE